MARKSNPSGEDRALEERHRHSALIDEFPVRYRPRLRQLTAKHGRFADLLATAPPLAVGIAGAIPDRTLRDHLLAQVEKGCRLSDVFEQAGLHSWMRVLPPAALDFPLATLPRSSAFARRVGPYVPKFDHEARGWLRWVATANRVAGEEFALWIARLRLYDRPEVTLLSPLFLSVFARFSITPCAALPIAPRSAFRDDLAFMSLVDRAAAWYFGPVAERLFPADGITDTWFNGYRQGEFEIVPLRRPAEFHHEAKVMQNCVDRYVGRVAGGLCRVFSVRRNSWPCATVEIRRPAIGYAPQFDHEAKGVANKMLTDPALGVVCSWIQVENARWAANPRRLSPRADTPLPKSIIDAIADAASPSLISAAAIVSFEDIGREMTQMRLLALRNRIGLRNHRSSAAPRQRPN